MSHSSFASSNNKNATPSSSAAQGQIEQMRRDYDSLRISSEDMVHEMKEAAQTVYDYAQSHYTASLSAQAAFETSAAAALTFEAAGRLVNIMARHYQRLQGQIEQHERLRLNINSIVESAVAMMRPRFDTDGQCVSIMAMGEPIYAEVDDGLLYQALVHLLAAAQSNPYRGSLLEVLLCDGLADFKILLIDHGRHKKAPESEADLHRLQLKEDMDISLAEKAILVHNGTLDIQRTEEWGRVITIQIPKLKPLEKLF